MAEALEGGFGRVTAWFVSAFRQAGLRGVLPTAEGGTWSLPRWFLVVFGVIAAGMVFMGRAYYFGTPLFETGDLAANSLQIDRATHFLEIYGNYSRFEFHHPGPAFFYVYGAGEVLFFDLLHLVPAPHNGQLLAGALLQSAFLATAICVLARFLALNRGLFVTGAIAIALVHFRLAGDPEFSLWPPDQLVVPFACFLVIVVAVALGWIELLPVIVLCGGFLVHGHVAQPLFVVPMAIAACGLGLWGSFHEDTLPVLGFVRKHGRSFLLALVILGIFLLPILRDAIHANSNLATILAYLNQPRANEDIHSWRQVIAYILSFLGYPADLEVLDFTRSQFVSFASSHWAGIAASLLVLIALPVGLLLTHLRHRALIRADATSDVDSERRAGGSRFFVTYYGFLVLGVGLTVVWVNIQRGPLFEFNSFFIYGLMYVAILPPFVSACRRWPMGRARLTTTLVGVLTVGLAVSTALPLPGGEDPGGLALNDSIRAVVAARTSPRAVLLEFAHDDWPEATGVALALQRSNVSWFVEPQWGFMFGSGHTLVAGSKVALGPETWFLTPPAPGHKGQIALGPRIAIYPRPPSLLTYPQGP